MQTVSTQSGPQRRKHRHAPGHRCSELQPHAFLRCQLQQVGTVPRNQLLVGRHYRFTGFERTPYNLLRRIQTSDQLDDDVHIRAQHRLDIIGPHHVCGNPCLLLPLNVAIANVGKAERLVAALAKNLRDRAPHGSKSNQRNFACGRVSPTRDVRSVLRM